jgi:predicted dehydrogenase
MISVGIIGFGRIGAEHAGWLASAKGIRAVAASDPTPARRQLAEQRGLRTHATVEGLIADPAVDVALVSTPTALHLEHASMALREGKHVMIEKPMALDFSGARAIAQLAQDGRRTVSVFHNRRWDVDYLTVKRAMELGTFGRVINVESRIGQWASCVGPAAREWRPGWRNEAGFGGGGLYDWGSHLVDQLWRMMLPAKAVRVFAQLRGNVWTADCDDFARVLIDFDNGAVGMVEINTTTTRPLPRWHVDGLRGSAESPYSLAFDLEVWSQVTFAPADGGTAELLPRATATETMSETAIWEQFGAAVRGEGEPAVTAESVLPTMRLLDAARQSSQRGCAVEVDAHP